MDIFHENVPAEEKITASTVGLRTIGVKIALWRNPSTGATIVNKKVIRVRTVRTKKCPSRRPKSVLIAKKQGILPRSVKTRKCKENHELMTTGDVTIAKKQGICHEIAEPQKWKEWREGTETGDRIRNVLIARNSGIFPKNVKKRGLSSVMDVIKKGI